MLTHKSVNTCTSMLTVNLNAMIVKGSLSVSVYIILIRCLVMETDVSITQVPMETSVSTMVAYLFINSYKQ